MMRISLLVCSRTIGNRRDADARVDATKLDYFVLDKFKALLEGGKTDAVLDQRLRSRHTVFFLHLLGLDTTGHGYGPHSKASPTR
jgi:phosphatidylinositol glycan class N